MTIIVKNFWHVLFSSPRQQILRSHSDDALPSPVILNGGKNALWKRREAAIWHKAKNLLLGWHLAVFLTTAADPSLAPWMTISVSCHYDDFFRRLSNAGKTVRMICAGARLFPKRAIKKWPAQASHFAKGTIIKSNLGRWEPIRYYFVTRDNLILSAWRASSDLVTGAPWI